MLSWNLGLLLFLGNDLEVDLAITNILLTMQRFIFRLCWSRSRKFLSVLQMVILLIAEFVRICLAEGRSVGTSFGRSVFDSFSVRHSVRA